MRAFQNKFVSVSESQTLMFKEVKRRYKDAQTEVVLDNFYVVDAYVPSKKLIVEIQGPLHFNHAEKLTRKSKIKSYILEKVLGNRVRHIDPLVAFHRLNRYDEHRMQRIITNRLSMFSQTDVDKKEAATNESSPSH